MKKIELFEKLSQVDDNGYSRWVNASEFTDKYASLRLNNGSGWTRKDGSFGHKYIVEFDRTIAPGNKIDRIRVVGYNNHKGSNYICNNIKNSIKKQKCPILGTSTPEVDHKDGRKNDDRIMCNQQQLPSDFQPLSKAANDAKRQWCKNVKIQGYDLMQKYCIIRCLYAKELLNIMTISVTKDVFGMT